MIVTRGIRRDTRAAAIAKQGQPPRYRVSEDLLYARVVAPLAPVHRMGGGHAPRRCRCGLAMIGGEAIFREQAVALLMQPCPRCFANVERIAR